MTFNQTSLITILSSEHGRMRREQRDISKRDLQRALKYGTISKTWGDRLKVEYDGIIFITDSSKRREITAFPSPLAMAPLDFDDKIKHQKAKHVIELKPELCASHTVLVVDNSGSMATHDINLHRDRQVAAYSVTALEFIAEQLFTGTANNSDVVSLVEFRRTAKVVFSREPISWVLYNKLLSRRDERNYQSRQSDQAADCYDSNYLPALEAADKLLETGDHETCALSLLFLSDGAPSDKNMENLTPAAAQKKICKSISSIASKFPGRLVMKLVGFGNEFDDFSVLQAMAQTVTVENKDVKAEFVYCEKMANEIGTAVSSLVTSITESRTSLMQDGGRNRTKRNVEKEAANSTRHILDLYKIVCHQVYDPKSHSLVNYPGIPFGALRDDNMVDVNRRLLQPPRYLALNKKHCGSGAERLAFRCQLADVSSDYDDNISLKFGTMVAKETNLVERIEENVGFHKKFCETQHLAAHLADEFNKRLKGLPEYDKRTTPCITFLQCSVLVVDDENWPGRFRSLLVEKMLDTTKFPWSKWNDNAGGLNGVAAHLPIDVDREYEKLTARKLKLDVLDEIAEEGSEEEEESDDESSVESVCGETDEKVVRPADYIQAFSHFTYRYTYKKVLVCDLQGIYNDTLVPPKFELTDPAIHYQSSTGREMVYGRTDKGMAGIQLFFRTHKCSKICKLMQLSARNKNWRRDWKRRNHRNGLF